MEFIRLYHFTPTRNLPSILARGLDPSCATGNPKLLWACDHERCQWALEHVAQIHDARPWALSLFSFRFDPERLASFSLPGIYRTGWIVSKTLLTYIPLYSLRSVARQTGIALSTIQYWLGRGWVAGSFSVQGTPVFTQPDLEDIRSFRRNTLVNREAGLVR